MSEPTIESASKPEFDALRKEVKRLNDQRLFRWYDSLPRLLGLQFLRGMALGLGTVVGATILVSVLVLLLSKIDFIPIIGEWAKEIAVQIQGDR
ncbi:MAG: DUF5665 domain-containing protein [Paracoccaceae bacterium]